MGARLSLLAPSAPTIAVSSYVDVLNGVQYIEVVNNSRFLKTIKAVDKTSGCLIIIKILIKPAGNSAINLHDVAELLAKESSILAAPIASVLPWSRIIETDRAGYLIRQHLKTNLYDRLSLRPFLEPVEKLFLVYQMIRVVRDIHQLKIHHGDLRLENFLVTLWNWLMLTDFATYVKPTFLPEDNPTEFLFYFDSSGRRVCYLAPERFYPLVATGPTQQNNMSDDGKYSGRDALTDEMDLFSLGCVITELYMEGEPMFTLSQLFKYMRGEYTPDLLSVGDPKIKQIILALTSLDPEKRTSAAELLELDVFPSFFGDFLYDFMAGLNNNDTFMVPMGNDNVCASDLKVDMIYARVIAALAKTVGQSTTNTSAYVFDGSVEAAGLLIRPHNPLALKESPSDHSRRNIANDDINLDRNFQKSPSALPLKLNLPGGPTNYTISPTPTITSASYDYPLIILNIIFSLLKTMRRPSSKLKACELILLLSERITDECKLDRSLPYLCYILDEYIEGTTNANNSNSSTIGAFSSDSTSLVSTTVACYALKAITTLLMSCTRITPLNALLFPEYILPKLSNLLNISSSSGEEKILVRTTIATCLPQLAFVAKKFWTISKTFDNEPSHFLHDTNIDSNNSFSISKEQLDEDFEYLALALLVDSNPLVKINLVDNILPLCEYFGVDKTNDLILPHLITYLNDSDTQLRLFFLDSLVELSPFIGVLAFEQYLLPLLIQTLCDQELFVILKVLEIFCNVIKNRLINPNAEFNALNMYNEILTNCVHLILHPNEWARQSVLNVILAVSDNLTDAERYCFLFPLIKTYLSYDVTQFTWNTLYPCLTKPLTKPVFELAITWSIQSTGKSLFWKQSSFTKSVKGMARSVYAPNKEVTFTTSNGRNSTVPLSPEDKQWLFKLKSVGLEHRELWKIFVMRDFIYRLSRAKSGTKLLNHFPLVDMIPRNIFFELFYKSEPIGSSTTETNVLTKERRDSNSLLLPNFGKVKASVQTVQANVFAELDNETHPHNHNSYGQAPVQGQGNSHGHNKVFSVNNEKVITANIRHSYSGYNPYMLNYLHSREFQPSIDSFSEFGPLIKTSRIGSTQPDWKPKGICVAQINTNVGNDIDGITCLAMCDTKEFFVTGSESGLLRVWDCCKLEKNVIVKNANLVLTMGARITSIKFIPRRYVFTVTTSDGYVRHYRVDIVRGKSKKIIKYNKCALIREYHLPIAEQGYFISCEYMVGASKALLVGITSTGKIIGLDIIKMEKVFEMQNSLLHGTPTSFVVDRQLCWLLVGTNKGVLSLWDLRFETLVKSWEICTDSTGEGSGLPIKQLVNVPSKDPKQPYHVAIIGGTGESDVSVWDMTSFQCRQVFSSYVTNPHVKTYQLKEIDNRPESTISKLLKSIDIDDEADEGNQQVTARDSMACILGVISERYLLSATSDKRIIYWDTQDPVSSVTLNKPDGQAVHFTNRATNRGLNLVNERFGENKNVHVGPKSTAHQDTITGLATGNIPYDLVVSTDRNGNIHLYM